MNVAKLIIQKLGLIRSRIWCIIHFVKYKKGAYIGHHVKKNHNVKLELSEGTKIGDRVLLWGNGTVRIGSNSSIGPHSRLYAAKGYGIEIGDYVNSASHLYIIDSNHGIEVGKIMMHQQMTHKKVVIGNDIWFGYHVTVLPGVTLEDGIVCGACAVITKSFPRNAVVCGNPGQIVKYRR